jgi:hypothetical protein
MREDHVLPLDVSFSSNRRRILLASLLAALPLGLSATRAEAINPSETQVTLSDQIKWTAWTGGPPHSAELATLFGGLCYSQIIRQVTPSSRQVLDLTNCDDSLLAWPLWSFQPCSLHQVLIAVQHLPVCI